jgi:iron complex outermembrane receptor protein
LWGGVARAVRTPSRTDSDVRINLAAFARPGALPTVLALVGDPDLESEELIAYELGYRVQASNRLSLDLAAFYDFYDNLGTFEPAAPFVESIPRPPHLVVPFKFDRKMRGETYGLEATANCHVTNNWKLSASYSLFRMELNRSRDSRDTFASAIEGIDPEHQFQAHSRLNLPRSFELDTGVYHVARLSALAVPSYTRIDLRFGWRPSENLALSFMTQSLLDARRPEFAENQGVIATEVQRSVYGRLTWRF